MATGAQSGYMGSDLAHRLAPCHSSGLRGQKVEDHCVQRICVVASFHCNVSKEVDVAGNVKNEEKDASYIKVHFTLFTSFSFQLLFK